MVLNALTAGIKPQKTCSGNTRESPGVAKGREEKEIEGKVAGRGKSQEPTCL